MHHLPVPTALPAGRESPPAPGVLYFHVEVRAGRRMVAHISSQSLLSRSLWVTHSEMKKVYKLIEAGLLTSGAPSRMLVHVQNFPSYAAVLEPLSMLDVLFSCDVCCKTPEASRQFL